MSGNNYYNNTGFDGENQDLGGKNNTSSPGPSQQPLLDAIAIDINKIQNSSQPLESEEPQPQDPQLQPDQSPTRHQTSPQPFVEDIPTPTVQYAPQYQALKGVVDLLPPIYVQCPIDREALLEPEIRTYTRESFKNDYKSNEIGCLSAEFFFSFLGILGLGGIAAGIALLVLKKGGDELPIVLLTIGIISYLIYSILYLCSTRVCCYCCVWKNECGLSMSYFESMYTGYDDTTKDTLDAVTQLSTDVPRLLFNVQCSHRSSGNKSKRTYITFDENYSVPILSYRYLGILPDDFIRSMDTVGHSGELLIDYIPELLLHPDQKDYLTKIAIEMVKLNEKRDSTCRVIVKFISVNQTVIITEADNKYWHRFVNFGTNPTTYDECNPDNVNIDTRFNQPGTYMQLSTSIGQWKSVYLANQKRGGNWLSQCFTHRYFFTFGSIIGLMPFHIWAWHSRFKRAIYRAPFYILLPRIDEILNEFNSDPQVFHVPKSQIKDIPTIQPSLGHQPLQIPSRSGNSGDSNQS